MQLARMVFPQTSGKSETSLGDVVDPVLRLDEEVLQFVLGNVGFGGGVETAEDSGGNCVTVFGPG